MKELLYQYFVIDRTHRDLRVACEENLGAQYKSMGLSPEERMTRRFELLTSLAPPIHPLEQIVLTRSVKNLPDGHIEDSRNLPLDEIDKVDSVIKDKNTPLYVHCLSGGRSARAAAYLRGKGYREVHDIGGIGSYRGKIVV